MKTQLLKILPAILLIIFVSHSSNAQMKMSSVPDVIAKPAFEGSDAGMYVKVWIMSIIRDMGTVEKNGKADDDDYINTTHNVLVQAEDEKGRIIPDETVKLLIVSPTGKKQAVDLDPKSDQYGGSVAFQETGEYQLTVSINADGRSGQRSFSYKVYR